MQNTGAAPPLETNYRPTEDELIDLRAYRESAEPDEPGADLEAFEDEYEALPPAELRAITDRKITEKFKSSEKAVNFVIDFEVGSPKLYERRYKSPIWPKGLSGITIGIGFDIGYHSAAEFSSAWKDHLSDDHFDRLSQAVGFKTGRGGNRAAQIARAKQLVRQLADIEIDFDIAKQVFLETTTPLHGRRALRVFKHMMELHPHAFGALFSLVYNRGSSMRGNRRREMRNIRDSMKGRNWDPIPREIRDMKRIWRGRGLKGLLRRRDGEADLFEEGLAASRTVAAASAPAAAAPVAVAASAPAAAADAGATEISAHDMGLESIQNWRLKEDNKFVANDDAEGDGEGWIEDLGSEIELESVSRDWARVRWIEDDKSTEYAHIKDRTLKGCSFDFNGEALKTLITVNSFEPLRDSGKIIFALRGAELVAGTSAPDERLIQENKSAIHIKETRPNHKDFRCVIGVYDLKRNILSAYTGSTVPCRRAIYGYVNKLSKCNMLPTGCYRYKVGYHRKIPGCLREDQNFCVLRNTDDYLYDIRDEWDPGFPADNLHPSFFYEKSAEFSSWGCLTVRGDYNRKTSAHVGQWSLFRNALGLINSADGDHGKRFSLILLTGLDAAIAQSLQNVSSDQDRERINSSLTRLRPGSQGPAVKRLQKVLNIKEDGMFGPILKDRLTKLQKSKLRWSDGIYSQAMDKELGLNIWAPGGSASLVASSAVGTVNGAKDGTTRTSADAMDPELESLFLELGKRSQIAQNDQEGFAQSTLPELEAFWDESDLVERGQRLFFRIEKSLHNLVCGDADADQEDRAQFQKLVNDTVGHGQEAVTRGMSRLISSYLLLPAPIADVAAELVVKRILSPALAEMGNVAGSAVKYTCTYWAERLRKNANSVSDSEAQPLHAQGVS